MRRANAPTRKKRVVELDYVDQFAVKMHKIKPGPELDTLYSEWKKGLTAYLEKNIDDPSLPLRLGIIGLYVKAGR